MKIGRTALFMLLKENVVELKFHRRHKKPGWNDNRRMLCTTNTKILNSAPGRIALHFKPPHGPPPFNAANYNLVTAWDLFWQEYRNISCEACDVITVMPIKTTEEQDEFWQYFNHYLESMGGGQKTNFMNK